MNSRRYTPCRKLRLDTRPLFNGKTSARKLWVSFLNPTTGSLNQAERERPLRLSFYRVFRAEREDLSLRSR